MWLKAFICIVAALGFVSMATAGCGKKAPPKPPDEVSWLKR